MTTAILSGVFVLWPLVAFPGGAGFAVLGMLAAFLLLVPSIPHLKPRLYMGALLAIFLYASVTTLWSPRHIEMFDFDFAKGDFAIRSEVIAVGGQFLCIAVLIAAVKRVDARGRHLILSIARIAFIVQFFVVLVLAMFEKQFLQLFAFAMPTPDEGVQNITRNALIMAMAAPFLIQGVTENRSPRMAILIAAAILVAESAVLWHRGVQGGLFSFFAAGLAVIIIAVWRRSGFRIIACGIALLVWTAPMLFGFLSFGYDAATAKTSAEYRLAIWQRVTEVISKHPIEGSGLGVLRTIKETIPAGEFQGQLLVPNHAHNMLLQLWAEMGAIGAGLLALTIVLVGWRLPAPEKLGLAAPRVAGLAGGITAIACVSFDVWREWFWAVAGLLVVLAAVVARENDLLAERQRARQLAPSPSVPRLGVTP